MSEDFKIKRRSKKQSNFSEGKSNSKKSNSSKIGGQRISSPDLIVVDKKVKTVLSKIGLPEESPFKADDFQTEAILAIQKSDVIVSAPTGSGKTYIALEAIKKELPKGGKIWYAAPLKALSNAKYLEFCDIFGEDKVGLLTGDHKVNLEAPLVVGTTEILRNQLYDVMSLGEDLDLSLVILDEAHYLGDPDRGVVWEEVLIYLPVRVKILMLSATIANAEQIANWLENNRGQKTEIIFSDERPVPLYPLTISPPNYLTSLIVRKRLNPKLSSLSSQKGQQRFARKRQPILHTSQIMPWLSELDLLPAIFFLKSRSDCDVALRFCSSNFLEDGARYQARERLINQYIKKYPFLRQHRHLSILRQKAVAAHHAGHLPHYKILVETLMAKGLLNAIFATSTVAAGVNFPARTVVIRQSDRFDGQSFSNLSVTELLQMTGRAGRRGFDKIGFALALPGPYLDLDLLVELFQAKPEPIESQLKLNFSMILNLLNSHWPDDVELLLNKSFSSYQLSCSKTPDFSGSAKALKKSFHNYLNFLKKEGLVSSEGQLTVDGQWASQLRLDHPLVMYQALKNQALSIEDPALLAALTAGLLFDKQSEKQQQSKYRVPKVLKTALNKLLESISGLISRLEKDDFEVPNLNFNAAWAIWSWAKEGNFELAVELLDFDAGDLAMLVYRTADHLRQFMALKEIYPLLAQNSQEAQEKILKGPLTVPL